MFRGVAAFVWQDLPPAGPLDPHVGTYLIKAANGNGVTAPGWDFSSSYAAWAARVGAAQTGAWTWLYGSTDGVTAARALVASAPGASSYGLDVEGDDPRWRNLDRCVRDCVAELRRLRPHTPVWFTSYPSREQAVAHGAPWDTLIAVCDFGVPQIYYASQAAQWPQIVADHRGKPVVGAFSPGDWGAWQTLATPAARRFGAVALWRYPDTDQLAGPIAALTAVIAPNPDGALIELAGVGHPVLAAGSRGPSVHAVQRALNEIGSWRGIRVDSVYGTATARAVAVFQKSRRLPATGRVDAATWHAIAAALTTLPRRAA